MTSNDNMTARVSFLRKQVTLLELVNFGPEEHFFKDDAERQKTVRK
jgi:hypothetical protein